MKWQDKLAILKFEGFDVHQTRRWKPESKEFFRYVCEISDDHPLYGAGDTKAEAVNNAWKAYVREKNYEETSKH